LITWDQLKLRRINSALVEVDDIPFGSVEEFASLSEESDRHRDGRMNSALRNLDERPYETRRVPLSFS